MEAIFHSDPVVPDMLKEMVTSEELYRYTTGGNDLIETLIITKIFDDSNFIHSIGYFRTKICKKGCTPSFGIFALDYDNNIIYRNDEDISSYDLAGYMCNFKNIVHVPGKEFFFLAERLSSTGELIP